VSGKPEPVYIDTWQAQRDYCHNEGLALPSDTSSGFISSDGKTFKPGSHSEAKEFVQHSNHEAQKVAAESV
jgi:hypothetical protein